MSKWKMKLAQWMQGRYGPDALYMDSKWLYIILAVSNLFVRSLILSAITAGALIWTIFRVFSKNRSKRAEENRQYLQFKDRLRKQFMRLKNRWKERNTHRYRPCPHCHTTLRLAKQIGTVKGTCPVCKKPFEIAIKR